MTSYVTESLLLLGIGSSVVVSTTAEFVWLTMPSTEGACAVMVIVSLSPAAIGVAFLVHVIIGFPVTLQSQPAPFAVTNVYPPGNTSVMFTSSAGKAPLLVTVKVNVTF